MDEKDFKSLALVRLERAKELYMEANELVKMDSYSRLYFKDCPPITYHHVGCIF